MFEDYKKGIFADYRKEVLNAYLDKKRRHELSSDLESPTPSKLRNQSLLALRDRYLKKDDQTLKLFFDPMNKFDDHEKSIGRLESDKFKPLVNFLKGDTNDTHDKNIKLLAWLIDFEPRPYEEWRNHNRDVKAETGSTIGEVGDISIPTAIPSVENGNEEVKKNKEDVGVVEKSIEETRSGADQKDIKRLVLYLIGVIVIAGVTYLFSRNSNQGCMFWAEDRYQPISCKEKVQDAAVIALDASLVDNLKKITQPDTLTKNALGNVWYIKMNADSIEFYTADGVHPIYNEKKLRPVTPYILDKYVQH